VKHKPAMYALLRLHAELEGKLKGEWVAEPMRSPAADRPWYGRTRVPDSRGARALAAPDEESGNEEE
jgi:hypothetical protein